ncbi:ABC transporter ATP-binding protein [Clostridium boliviensis]|uniref:ABC transporter ATP-binding protein n=1 Tax=Clostridium boliviensis TaxID=318465 RepID=A0ABU4GH54_9CLOT|nr:ABC transporter ATP-binding protein [Clostridium boliviensis]MDW2796928.1 ABC transporter ATP-binding protein [Clostridium boliviensis]
MKRYWKYIRPYLSAFILAPVLMLTEVFGEILLPRLTSLIINNGVLEKNDPYIIKMGMIMVFIAVIMVVGGIGAAYYSAKASISFSTDLRKDIFHKVQEFSFKNIDDFSTGSLVTRLTNDIQQIQNVVMLTLRMMFRAPGLLIGGLIMAFIMNRHLVSILLVVIPVLVIMIGIILVIAFPRFEIMQKKIDRLNSGVQEALTNVRVIKSFVREKHEEEKFRETNRDLKEGSLNAMKVVITSMPLMMLMMNITTIAVVWYGGNLIIAGRMPVGDLTAFTIYIVQILMSLMMLSMVFLQASRAMASLKRVREVLDTEIDLNDEQAAEKSAQITAGKVEFRNVCFRYEKETEELVLDHINFTANPGETIGIIGATGSGKTSMVQLIPRLYDADEGEVLVDGINVKDYLLKNLRESVGMVLQKNVLFSGTIEENLRWGNENADMDEIILMSQSAQAHGFVSGFKDGYDTDLGQGGSNVSGGQKQRLCIARTLLKKPKILILDDSTSAVDTATEAKIRQSFATTLKDTTKFIIAQRIGSVEYADKIIVLDEGKIAGMGNHEELMETCEAYQEIYYSQKERKKEAGA